MELIRKFFKKEEKYKWLVETLKGVQNSYQ